MLTKRIVFRKQKQNKSHSFRFLSLIFSNVFNFLFSFIPRSRLKKAWGEYTIFRITAFLSVLCSSLSGKACINLVIPRFSITLGSCSVVLILFCRHAFCICLFWTVNVFTFFCPKENSHFLL